MMLRSRVAVKVSRTVGKVAVLLRDMSTLDKSDVMKYLSTPPYTLPNVSKIEAPPMVYISGEEMTHYTMNLM